MAKPKFGVSQLQEIVTTGTKYRLQNRNFVLTCFNYVWSNFVLFLGSKLAEACIFSFLVEN